MEITDAPVRVALLGAGRGEQAPLERVSRARDVLADVPGLRGLLEQALYLDTRMFLPDGILLCNDKMSMAAGLELRVPFLDLELMRFVERIPASARVRHVPASACTARRWRRILPPGIAGDGTASPPRTTTGWGVAGREGRAPLRARRGALGLVDPGAVGRLVAEHRTGRADHKSILFCLELSEWHRTLRGGAGAGAGVTKRILFVPNSNASFVQIDRAILAERASRSRTSTSPGKVQSAA